MTNPSLNFDLSAIPSPCFVLDERLLLRNLELLQNIQHDAKIKILCAFKGYAMWSTFPLLRKYISGATASSLHEAKLCHEEYGKKAHLCAPVYIDSEIEEITNISSHITFNSISQYERFGHIAINKGLKIALRINPEYSEIETDLYNPCVPGSRLGINSENLPDKLTAGITGLHFHSLCGQNADTLARTLMIVEEKFEKYLHQISWLNIGGGHHFTRKDYDVDLFVNTMISIKEKYNLEVIAEPGEAVGWKTGYLVSTVQDIVKSNGISTALLDVSFAAHMPDCLEMPYKPNVFGEVKSNQNAFTCRLGGNTCLAGDLIGGFHFAKPLEIGDKIVFEDMINYTMVKTNTFNGVKLPSIGVIKSNGSFELVKQFGYQDYKSRLS
ncbi:MAG: carboxynorspermidine decarboxylase [Cyclobacteriaceae bacterium]|nr:carboxynorspermidine decarboxylase [Cyclobacteriaceae bacterium]